MANHYAVLAAVYVGFDLGGSIRPWVSGIARSHVIRARTSIGVPSLQAHARPPARTRTHALAPAQTRYCASVLKAKQCMRKLWKIRTIRSDQLSSAQLSTAAAAVRLPQAQWVGALHDRESGTFSAGKNVSGTVETAAHALQTLHALAQARSHTSKP